ncbi:MAG: hypothetical protein Q8O67_12975 [Deltaproteobacteria bacterium]|nr:hypothetical protein [Deltaproteobacteria bacterium]
MKRAIHLALTDAVDLARSRGAALARVTLQGADGVDVVARTLLEELGLAHVEVALELMAGPPRLSAVELLDRAPAPWLLGRSAREP